MKRGYIFQKRGVCIGILFLCFFIFSPKQIVLANDCADEDTECINNQINALEKKLKSASKKKEVLEQNPHQINSSLTSTQIIIQKTQVLLNEAKQTIDQKEQEITNLEKQLQLEKEVLKKLIRELAVSDETPLPEIILSSEDILGMFRQSDSLFSTQEKMQGVIEEIRDMQVKVTDEKGVLEDVKQDQEKLLTLKSKQKQSLVAEQRDTAGDIEDQQTIISRLKKELGQLQNDLNFLTGKSYDAKDIREAVEFASKRTGVPEGVLYGFLKKETNLGANTGQCTYAEVEKVSIARYKKYGSKYKNSIALLYTRRDFFYDIVSSLGYNKNKKVSCSPNYIGQGGAMGVSQFMSDVWKGYASQISSQTGHGKPDPWNLTDGVMAMGLKLKRAGATSDKESVIRSASIAYLGAFNRNYYEGIVYWSKNYKSLFK